MDMVEPFVALVIYPTTPDGQSRQATTWPASHTRRSASSPASCAAVCSCRRTGRAS